MKCDEKMLVIAADASFRRSLAFLFETEGFQVTERDVVPDIALAPGDRSCCAVVDEGLIDENPEIWRRLGGVTDSIVVLLDRARELPTNLLVHVVEKPLLGDALIDTVRAARLRCSAST